MSFVRTSSIICNLINKQINSGLRLKFTQIIIQIFLFLLSRTTLILLVRWLITDILHHFFYLLINLVLINFMFFFMVVQWKLFGLYFYFLFTFFSPHLLLLFFN